MAEKPLDLTLELAPKARFDVVDLRSHFSAEHEATRAYRNCLYWSFHTTAGFLDRSLAARLSAQHIPGYVDAFRMLHPEDAGFTLPTPEPHIRLDYVFTPHAQAGRVISCEVVRTAAAAAASDHFPVVSDLRIDD